MSRPALAGLLLALAACGGGAERPGPVPVVVVSDSLGNLPGAGVPSPDGTRIAFARTVAGKSAIWVADLDGGNARRLSHGVWDFDPWWSADGKWIAYHAESPDFDVFVVSVDGGEPRQVTSGPATDRPRGWLRDGSALVVARSGDGDDHTLLVPLDGSAPRRLGPAVRGDHHLAFSPDESKVAFDLHAGGGDATIWVQDLAAGTAPRQLTTENLENAAVPFMWSPDGRFVAYTSRRTGTTDIWIADVTSGETRQLTTDVRDDFQARWSPDGRWIAFLSDRGGQLDLWVVPSAGGKAQRVTNDRALEVSPRWSPDGRELHYARNENDAALRLFPLDGGTPTTLLQWQGHTIGGAVLSPDGKTLLFNSDRSGNVDIWSLPAAGGEPVPFAASSFADGNPNYSPDGRRVLFHSNRGGSNDLWVAPAEGGEPTRLTMGPSNEGEAAWSPDGKTVAFASPRGGNADDLWLIPSSGGQATRLTQGELRPAVIQWSPDGRFVYFVGERAGGARELYRVPAGGGRPQPLGAARGIRYGRLSPDGSQFAYSSFEGGWAFVDLLPTGGGTPRRLTPKPEGVFQPLERWSPDGTHLVVADLDLEGNRDTGDLLVLRLADGDWRHLTRTPRENENPHAFTPDGSRVLAVVNTLRTALVRLDVSAVLATAPAR